MYARDISRLQHKLVNTSAGGTLECIAAVSGERISIYAVELVLASATTVEFKSGLTSLTGPQTLTSKVLDFLAALDAMYPRYVCTVSEAFNITFGSAVQCSGVIYYTQE